MLRVDRRFKAANVLIEEQTADNHRGVFFFRSKLIFCREGEGPTSRSKLCQETVTGGPSRQP
jgi:hypothetical protein